MHGEKTAAVSKVRVRACGNKGLDVAVSSRLYRDKEGGFALVVAAVDGGLFLHQ